MNSKLGKDNPLRKLFDGLLEQIFMVEIGICDTRLTGYLSDLMCDFIHMDRVFRLKNLDGQTIREISKFEAEAALPAAAEGSERTRLINRYIGDFSLFWTGLYPEQLTPRHQGVDRLYEYVLQGKRSYGIASELDGPEPPGPLLRQLSEEFEACVHGLHLVRAGWEHGNEPSSN